MQIGSDVRNGIFHLAVMQQKYRKLRNMNLFRMTNNFQSKASLIAMKLSRANCDDDSSIDDRTIAVTCIRLGRYWLCDSVIL